MGFADKYNKKNLKKVEWGLDTSSFPYVNIKELTIGSVYPLRGFFITPDKGYGQGAVLITDGQLVNVSNRYVDQLKEMFDDDELIEAIKNDLVGFTVSTFVSKTYKRVGYAFDIVDR